MGIVRVNLLPACFLVLAASSAEGAGTHPLWNGGESVAAYARRAGLEPVRRFRLAPDVELEMVLIPAGRFRMGAPEAVLPERSMEGACARLLLTGVLLASLVALVLVRSLRTHRRPQFSLAYLMVTTCSAALCVWSVIHYHTVEADWDWYNQCLVKAVSMDASTKPAHWVTLTRPFYLSKHELTEAQYRAVTGRSGAYVNRSQKMPLEEFRAHHVSLSDSDALAFRDLLRRRFASAFRLPSEAEWEFACRAGSRGSFCGRHDSIESSSIYVMRDTFVGRVGHQSANPFGLHDMRTNIWEWCADWYAPYAEGDATDPHGPRIASGRVIRGGRCRNTDEPCADCCRWMAVSRCGPPTAGVRLALDLRNIEAVHSEELAWDLSVTWRTQHQVLKFREGDIKAYQLTGESEWVRSEGEDKDRNYYEVSQGFRPDPPVQGGTILIFSLLDDEQTAIRLFRETLYRGLRPGVLDAAIPKVGDECCSASWSTARGRCQVILRVRRGRLLFSLTCLRLNSSKLPVEHVMTVCRRLIARYDALELDRRNALCD